MGNDYLDAIRRKRPTVTGDGTRNIRELVERENARRAETPYTAMHPLSVDLEMRAYLREHGHNLDTVLPQAEVVEVKRVVNQNCSRENVCVRELVHPSIIDAGRRAARIFGIEFAGFDVITPDITRPLEEVGGVINEVNTTPGLHHHYLISDPSKAFPIATRLLEHIFGEDTRDV